MNKPRLSLIVRAVTALGVSVGTAVFLALQFAGGVPDREVGYIKWGNVPAMESEPWQEATAVHDWCAFTFGAWEGRTAEQHALIGHNVDIMMGTYFNVHTMPVWMQQAAPGTWARTLADTVRGRFAATTAGDTAGLWYADPLVDLADPDVRADMIDVVSSYVDSCRLDWVFLDFLSTPLPDFKHGAWVGNQVGELDLDRDGVGHTSDPDEIRLLESIWYSYMDELRSALPLGTRLIANGTAAITDTTLSGKLDGCYLEDFPLYAGWVSALDPKYPYSLHYLTSDRWAHTPGHVMVGNTYNRDWTHIVPDLDGLIMMYWHKQGVLPPYPWEER